MFVQSVEQAIAEAPKKEEDGDQADGIQGFPQRQLGRPSGSAVGDPKTRPLKEATASCRVPVLLPVPDVESHACGSGFGPRAVLGGFPSIKEGDQYSQVQARESPHFVIPVAHRQC